jgi:hypothetical protein
MARNWESIADPLLDDPAILDVKSKLIPLLLTIRSDLKKFEACSIVRAERFNNSKFWKPGNCARGTKSQLDDVVKSKDSDRRAGSCMRHSMPL